MARAVAKINLLQIGREADGGGMKRVAGNGEEEHVLGIPLVVSVAPITVEPPLAIVVPLDVEQLRIAIRVGYV